MRGRGGGCLDRGGGGQRAAATAGEERSDREQDKNQQQEGEGGGGGRGGGGSPVPAETANPNGSIEILYCNAQSVVGKIDELCCIANDMSPDFILLTESWCNDETSEAFLSVPGYELQQDLRVDRQDTAGGRGGGLLVYSKAGKKILALDKVVVFNQYCRFLIDDITVYLIYRPPGGGQESIEGLTELVRTAETRTIMIGDFNFPEICWDSGQTAARTRTFLETTTEAGMEQLVTFPTHVKGNKLDLLLTNVPERVLEVEDAGRLGHSDHVMITAKLTARESQPIRTRDQPDWSKADWAGMREELGTINWRMELDNKNVEEAWTVFTNKIHKAVDKHVPVRRKRNQNRPAWLSTEILRAIRRKKRLWTRAKVGEQVEEYNKVEKDVKKMIRTAKRKFEKKLAEGGGKDGVQKRRFYAYVKQRTRTRPSIGPLKDREGRVVREDREMAGLFNGYFSSVFTREDTANVPEPDQMRMDSVLGDIQVTRKKVSDKIKKLKKGAASGPDMIGSSVLQELVDVVSSPLATIMRKSLDQGQVPQDWKAANVTPIFKKGSKYSPGNYRPVSLTSVSCKVFESIIRDDITSHLDKNRLIKPSQHGFMRGRSCASNLLSFLERTTAAVDRGEAVDIVFLDFAKAFDKVPIKRLLKKVWAHGIRGKVYEWIRAWLEDRLQRVVLNGEASDWAAVLSGVPQGSVLGPLLFLIFINDLDEAGSAAEIIRKFADDTKVAQPIRTRDGIGDQAKLQAALDGLVGWAARWGMSFNVQKCKIMHVGHANPRARYHMGGTELDITEEERDIGVTMSSKLKPGPQCLKAARTAQQVLGQILRAFQARDKFTYMQLYKTYVRPHLEFACQAWSPWSAADKEVLEKVQQRAVRQVSGLKGPSYEEKLKELDMCTLEERRHRADMAMVYKILTGKMDIDAREFFEMAATSGRATRVAADPLNVTVKHGRLDIRRNFFSVRVTELWNNVPSEIKQLRSLDGFKKAYAKHRQDMLY